MSEFIVCLPGFNGSESKFERKTNVQTSVRFFLVRIRRSGSKRIVKDSDDYRRQDVGDGDTVVRF